MPPTIWRLRLDPESALRLVAEFDMLHPSARPILTGMIGPAGVALYVQSRYAVDTGLLLTLIDYGGVETPIQLLPEGLTWADGAQLAPALAALCAESEVRQ